MKFQVTKSKCHVSFHLEGLPVSTLDFGCHTPTDEEPFGDVCRATRFIPYPITERVLQRYNLTEAEALEIQQAMIKGLTRDCCPRCSRTDGDEQ